MRNVKIELAIMLNGPATNSVQRHMSFQVIHYDLMLAILFTQGSEQRNGGGDVYLARGKGQRS
ncbi:MAG: hypothetical protein AUI16_29810 [Alphaproteobacteria bacterium 13_2_20CM_2_64_7]|nr:MAG: hypothetical protein AUI16_29810 [Alphaproteobacteria bacterium 13_2_20CM_2_64_7]